MDLWNTVQSTYETEVHAIRSAFLGLDRTSFLRAVDALSAAPRIAASGCGHSGIACRHFAHLMCCIERPARFISPAEAVHGATGYLQKGDVMLLASRGGKTTELLAILDICQKKEATVIAATENMRSPLALRADIVLNTPVTREVDRFNTQGTSSFAVLNVLFDALQNALIEATGFSDSQFALTHPGGAVGERLNQTALFCDPAAD